MTTKTYTINLITTDANLLTVVKTETVNGRTTMLDTANIEKQIARLMATLPAAQAETECAPLFLELARIHEIRMTARRSKT